MDKLLITNARILDPSCQPPLDFVGDILVEGERIVKVGAELSRMEIAKDAKVIDAAGLCAAPGFIDIHVHLRDPGFTHKEDILTGCQAAAAGGVTSVCCMPNTKPVTDSEEVLSYILNKAKDADARVYPIASITKGMHGEELNDFAMLHACGAAAVSDDGRPVENAGMMLEALKKAYRAGVPVVSHCEDLSIIDGGIINKGKVSEELGVRGMDRASEDSITVREIVLAESSDTAIHIAHVSTKGSVQLIREAKARGVRVTCETAPHYMMMTDELLPALEEQMRQSVSEQMDVLLESMGGAEALQVDQAQLDALIDQQVQMVMEMERQLFESLQINGLSCDMLITDGVINDQTVGMQMEFALRDLVDSLAGSLGVTGTDTSTVPESCGLDMQIHAVIADRNQEIEIDFPDFGAAA
mgnify:CR=1 FL=1